MIHRILATGSKGNSVIVGDVLFDAGLTKKKLLEMADIAQIKHVFISHHHDDHCKLPLLRYFIKEGISVYIPKGVVKKLLDEGKMVDPFLYQNVYPLVHKTYDLPSCKVTALPQKHWDIVNYAFIMERDDKRYLYATDLDTLSPTETGVGLYNQGTFDVIFLEGNYDEDWLREYIINAVSLLDDKFDFESLTSDALNAWVRGHYHQLPKQMAADLFRAVQNMRHLSKQQARLYVKDHLKPQGVYYEMHRSSLFYEKQVLTVDAFLSL